jgi:hypothetical protein
VGKLVATGAKRAVLRVGARSYGVASGLTAGGRVREGMGMRDGKANPTKGIEVWVGCLCRDFRTGTSKAG